MRLPTYIGVLVLLFTFVNVSTGQQCLPPPPVRGELAFPLSEAYGPNPDVAVNWYYVVGSLCELQSDGGCDNPVGFIVDTEIMNTTNPDNSTFISTFTTFGLAYGGQHFGASAMGIPPIYPNPYADIDLRFESDPAIFTASFTLLEGEAGAANSLYSILAITPNLTLSLVLRSRSPLMMHGDGGYVGALPPYPAPLCGSFWYASMPHLETVGTVRLNNDVKMVSGLSWWDHQWGTGGPAGLGVGGGWLWIAIHVANSSIMVMVTKTNYYVNPSKSFCELQTIDGSMTRGVVTLIETLTNWTSPASGNVYPIEVRVHTTLAAASVIHVTPYFSDQEVDTRGPRGEYYPVWEGNAAIDIEKGTTLGGVQGTGQLELIGFTPYG